MVGIYVFYVYEVVVVVMFEGEMVVIGDLDVLIDDCVFLCIVIDGEVRGLEVIVRFVDLLF